MSHRSVLLIAMSLIGCAASAQDLTGQLTVRVDKPSHAISPTFFGMMTEEINHAYDGGLYAELIQNRSFNDNPDRPVHWTPVGEDAAATLTLDRTHPVPDTALRTALRVDASKAQPGHAVGAANDGYWGIPVQAKLRYRGSFFARGEAGFTGPLTVAVSTADGMTAWATATVTGIGDTWKQFTFELVATDDASSSTTNRLSVTTSSPGVFELAQVSLFPPTFNGRENGLRPDLMNLMAGLKPSFLRLPGGNYLEGNTIAERFDWKKTIGPISQRPGHPCPWGYPSTDGMGLLEFLTWCEDLKMEPLLGIFAGYSLRGEHIPAGPGLEPFVQDALDEAEYLTGDASTPWGARRVQDGHPKPFPLHFIEVGNEDWFDRSESYEGRFAQFYDAFRKKYPQLKLIATMPVKGRVPDLIDDHYYRSAQEMQRDSGHYDSYSRKGPKIFVGEWATLEGTPTPHLQAALGDAAWLTGLERNSDIVELEAYAPLFVNVNRGAWQWRTNLIGYDALRSFGSPAYWVQAMFGQNTGDTVLPFDLSIVEPPKPPVVFHGKAGVGTYRTDAQYKDFKVTSNGKVVYQSDFSKDSGDWKFGPGEWKIADGTLRQTSDLRGTKALSGDASWTDYTIEVKGRKLSGHEGFFVLFHAIDGDFWQWNVGGWNNTRTAIQHVVGDNAQDAGASRPVTVETGRWYDLKLEVSKGRIKTYIDGKLINDSKEEVVTVDPVYAAASRVDASGEIILKIVNVSHKNADLTIKLRGVGKLNPSAKGWVLTGQPLDQNTLEEPEKVAPKEITVTGVSPVFKHTAPAHSVTVLRLKRVP